MPETGAGSLFWQPAAAVTGFVQFAFESYTFHQFQSISSMFILWNGDLSGSPHQVSIPMFIPTVSSSFQSNACGYLRFGRGPGRLHWQKPREQLCLDLEGPYVEMVWLDGTDLVVWCWTMLDGYQMDGCFILFRCNMLKLPKIDPKNAIPHVFCNLFHTQISGRYLAQHCHGLHNGFALWSDGHSSWDKCLVSTTCCSRQATGDDEPGWNRSKRWRMPQNSLSLRFVLQPWELVNPRQHSFLYSHYSHYSYKRTIEKPPSTQRKCIKPPSPWGMAAGFPSLVSCCLANRMTSNDLQQAATRKGPAIDDPEDVALREGCESSDSTECREMTQ